MEDRYRSECANLDGISLAYDEFGTQHQNVIVLIHDLGTQRIALAG
ncbi:MAG: hypothetical protein ACJAYG_001484 [Oceanicoccus sp.]|jgi:hypothetical protein